jgi:putative tricarboxylic transport membrane protein
LTAGKLQCRQPACLRFLRDLRVLEEKTMWYANVIAGVAVLLLGIGVTILAWLTLPYTSDFGPGPAFVPFWLGIVLAISAVPVVVSDLRSKERSERLFRPETAKCLQVLILIVAVFLTLPVVGFSAGLALITAGSMRLMGRHRWLSCLATAIGTAVCIHYLFGQWLGIPLPTGMLGL